MRIVWMMMDHHVILVVVVVVVVVVHVAWMIHVVHTTIRIVRRRRPKVRRTLVLVHQLW